MIIKALSISEKDGIGIADTSTSDLSDNSCSYWIDLQNPKSKDLENFLNSHNIKGLAQQICLESRNSPGFYPLHDEMVMVIPVLPESDAPNQKEYLLVLCRENLMISIHNNPITNLDLVNKLNEADTWLGDRSIGGLLSAIMIHISLEMLKKTVLFREQILKLEERMDESPESISAEDLISMRSKLVNLGTIVSDQIPSVQAMSIIDKSYLKSRESKEFLNCALVNLQSADSSLSWMDQRLSSLRNGFQMHAQDKMNKRLDALTILTAIFNPLTLIAGIWGMNFINMPELNLHFGYPLALGFMGLLGTGMFLFFRKGGWFG